MVEPMKYELYHHGVKGQQWGVRNGPPYPIDDRVLKKGTKLNSVSPYLDSDQYKDRGRPIYTYRPDDEWDNKVYKGPFSAYMIQYRGARFIKEHQYETVEDLTMPTKKNRVDEFKALPMKQLIKDLKSVQTRLVKFKIGSEKEQREYKNLNLNKLETEDDWKIAYSIFNHAMESVNSYKSTREYMKRMSSKYGAMVDDNNQGVYNNAHDPIIVFNAKKFLKTVGNTRLSSDGMLKIEDIIRNLGEVRTELTKEGKQVKF